MEGEVAKEGAILGGDPVPLMEVSGEEIGSKKPSEGVHGHLHFGWSRRSVSTDRLRRDFRAGRAWPGSRASSRWQP